MLNRLSTKTIKKRTPKPTQKELARYQALAAVPLSEDTRERLAEQDSAEEVDRRIRQKIGPKVREPIIANFTLELFRKLYLHGDQIALPLTVLFCWKTRAVVPDWAVRALASAFFSYIDRETGSLEDVMFPAPPRRGADYSVRGRFLVELRDYKIASTVRRVDRECKRKGCSITECAERKNGVRHPGRDKFDCVMSLLQLPDEDPESVVQALRSKDTVKRLYSKYKKQSPHDLRHYATDTIKWPPPWLSKRDRAWLRNYRPKVKEQ